MTDYEFKIQGRHPESGKIKEVHALGHWSAEREIHIMREDGLQPQEGLKFRVYTPKNLVQRILEAVGIKSETPWETETVENLLHYCRTRLI